MPSNPELSLPKVLRSLGLLELHYEKGQKALKSRMSLIELRPNVRKEKPNNKQLVYN